MKHARASLLIMFPPPLHSGRQLRSNLHHKGLYFNVSLFEKWQSVIRFFLFFGMDLFDIWRARRFVDVIDLYNFNSDYVNIFCNNRLFSGFSFFRSFAIKIDLSFHFQVAYIHNFNLLNSFKIFKSFELFIVRYL